LVSPVTKSVASDENAVYLHPELTAEIVEAPFASSIANVQLLICSTYANVFPICANSIITRAIDEILVRDFFNIIQKHIKE
jgi:hypothetical protein